MEGNENFSPYNANFQFPLAKYVGYDWGNMGLSFPGAGFDKLPAQTV